MSVICFDIDVVKLQATGCRARDPLRSACRILTRLRFYLVKPELAIFHARGLEPPASISLIDLIDIETPDVEKHESLVQNSLYFTTTSARSPATVVEMVSVIIIVTTPGVFENKGDGPTRVWGSMDHGKSLQGIYVSSISKRYRGIGEKDDRNGL
jgi:hypothetical protein